MLLTLPGYQLVAQIYESPNSRIYRARYLAIAEQLVISMPTVKSHLTHILQKLNVSSRFEAVERARELGIIQFKDFNCVP